jgi:hypothetical protein
MKEYKFLMKPIFFIFSLVFATWLVLVIERISPSDMGRYESLFKTETRTIPSITNNKQFLKTLFQSYQNGKIDSIAFENKLNDFLRNIKK